MNENTDMGRALQATPATVLTVSYDGSGFSGFARQPGQTTVQGELERSLSTVLRRPVELAVAGRTDAGVHARGQVVSFPYDSSVLNPTAFVRSVNALAGERIAVRAVRSAVPGFSARFDAKGREYRYRIGAGPVPPLFLRGVAWWVPRELDLNAMRQAAEHLIGEHDFKSFCVTVSAIDKPTKRRVSLIEVTEEEHLGESSIVVRVVGNAFLHSMVRVIAGTLVEVGAGRREPEWVAHALAACERAAAGPTAPAHGLTLWHVNYAEGVWL